MIASVFACGFPTSSRSIRAISFEETGAKSASLQPPLLPQPQERGSEGPLALSALLLEPSAVGGVKLVQDRIRRRFVVAEGNRPAIVREPEPGEIGCRRIAGFLEDRERGNHRLDVAPQ